MREFRLTQRAVDLRDSAAFTSIFLASSFSCSQAFSKPARKPLTPAVRQPSAKPNTSLIRKLVFRLSQKANSLLGLVKSF